MFYLLCSLLPKARDLNKAFQGQTDHSSDFGGAHVDHIEETTQFLE